VSTVANPRPIEMDNLNSFYGIIFYWWLHTLTTYRNTFAQAMTRYTTGWWHMLTACRKLLPPFQIVGCFSKSTYINFAMHLNIHCVYIHSKNYVSWFVKTNYNLERMDILDVFSLIDYHYFDRSIVIPFRIIVSLYRWWSSIE
jgi:hypothetical protein